jgi:outer membrane protein assembly factor BamA
LTVHVNEGLQYRLEGVPIRSSNPDDPLIFPSDELRELIHVQEGDILRAKKVREAIEAIMELYRSDGYIDAVLTPILEMDDRNQRISLVMEIDQEKRYRLGNVEVFGPNAQMEDLLRSTVKSGEVYQYRVVENFLKEHKSSLPPDISFQDIDFHRNVKSGTMDIRFNFQTCEQLQR